MATSRDYYQRSDTLNCMGHSVRAYKLVSGTEAAKGRRDSYGWFTLCRGYQQLVDVSVRER